MRAEEGLRATQGGSLGFLRFLLWLVMESPVMKRSEIGQLGLEFCSIYPEGLCGFDGPATTENGQPVTGR